jgi:hypothetical protein
MLEVMREFSAAPAFTSGARRAVCYGAEEDVAAAAFIYHPM